MYCGCWPVYDVIHSCLKNTSRSYRKIQLLLGAEVQILTLKEEALELGRYIKGKGKGKAVGDGVKMAASTGKEETVGGSGTGEKVIRTGKKSKC